MKRVSKTRPVKTQRKRLDKPAPDRLDPTLAWVGPYNAFSKEQLEGLEYLSLDKLFANCWLFVYNGPGYRDADKCATKKIAEDYVAMFANRYRGMKVEWLEVKTPRKRLSKEKTDASFNREDWLEKVSERRNRNIGRHRLSRV